MDSITLPTVPVNLPVSVPTLPTEILSENPIVQQIKFYADQIKCDDFKGKGSIEDYTQLFEAASKIANETKRAQLDIDIEGFNKFGQAADELSQLFTSLTKKIETNLDDCQFLSAVLSALQKIDALSKAFRAFQESILTNKIESSIDETKKILEGVSEEVECAMKYISHFSSPTILEGANLNEVNRNAITRAINRININVSTDTPDIQYIKRTNQTFIQQSVQLRTTTKIIRERYSYYF